MVILDTNVLSETLKPRPDPAVLAWFATRMDGDLYITTITQAEILSGVEGSPDGRRKRALRDAIQSILEGFNGRILPFDEDAAQAFPGVRAGRARHVRPISTFDALIASIAHSRGAAVATRDTSGFEDCGVNVIDPWTFRR